MNDITFNPVNKEKPINTANEIKKPEHLTTIKPTTKYLIGSLINSTLLRYKITTLYHIIYLR